MFDIKFAQLKTVYKIIKSCTIFFIPFVIRYIKKITYF